MTVLGSNPSIKSSSRKKTCPSLKSIPFLRITKTCPSPRIQPFLKNHKDPREVVLLCRPLPPKHHTQWDGRNIVPWCWWWIEISEARHFLTLYFLSYLFLGPVLPNFWIVAVVCKWIICCWMLENDFVNHYASFRYQDEHQTGFTFCLLISKKCLWKNI